MNETRRNKLGKLPARPGAVKLKFSDYFDTTALPEPPAKFGHDTLVTGGFPLLCNDIVGNCITPDTKVLTADLQWVAAGSLRVGDKLLGFDEEHSGGNAGRRFKESEAINTTIVTRPCYELTFSDGTMVTSSEGHKWLTKSTVQGQLGCQRWQRTEDLRVGPVRQTKVIKPLDVWEEDHSWHAGYLAGAFDGEGNLENYYTTTGRPATHTRVNFSQTDNKMLHQVELSLKELGFEPTNYTHQRHSQARVDGTPRKDIARISIGTRGQFLRFMGSVRPRRLLTKMTGNYGRIPGDSVGLVSKVYVGEREVVMLDTTSRTYFANGLASHNCAVAGALHQVQLWNAEAGVAIPVTDQAAITNYQTVTGYVRGPEITGFDADGNAIKDHEAPPNPSDQGTDVPSLLKQWYQTGIVDAAGRAHQIGAAVALEPGNWEQFWYASYYADGISIGLALDERWQTAFQQNKPWKAFKRPDVEGGHYIVGVAFDNDEGIAPAATWGGIALLAKSGYEQGSDETYALLSQEKLRNGIDLEGRSFAQLSEDLPLLLNIDDPGSP